MSDYLWEKQGAPDGDVLELERLLAPLEYVGLPPRLPSRRRSSRWLAAGVAAAAAAAIALVALRPWRPAPVEPPRAGAQRFAC